MSSVFVTGTDTGVGKTVVTAAWAAPARAGGERVAVVKLAQTGTVDGDSDVAEIRRLSGLSADAVVQFADYPEPLAPATAARRAGWPALRLEDAAACLAAVVPSEVQAQPKPKATVATDEQYQHSGQNWQPNG